MKKKFISYSFIYYSSIIAYNSLFLFNAMKFFTRLVYNAIYIMGNNNIII